MTDMSTTLVCEDEQTKEKIQEYIKNPLVSSLILRWKITTRRNMIGAEDECIVLFEGHVKPEQVSRARKMLILINTKVYNLPQRIPSFIDRRVKFLKLQNVQNK